MSHSPHVSPLYPIGASTASTARVSGSSGEACNGAARAKTTIDKALRELNIDLVPPKLHRIVTH